MPRKRRTPRPRRPYMKPGVSGERFQEDAAFTNSRRASTEFGDAAKCAALIRRQFMEMLEGVQENEIHKRLTKLIAPIIRQARKPGAGHVNLNHIQWNDLEGTEFNSIASSTSLIIHAPAVTIHMFSGKITITQPPTRVENSILKHKPITHIRLVAGAAAIDFLKKTSVTDYTASDYLPKNQLPKEEITLSLDIPRPVIHPVFVAVGIICYKQHSDTTVMNDLLNQRFKALSIIRVQPILPGNIPDIPEA